MRFEKRLIPSALLCCALWGSAFPCVKIGYELFSVTDTGSQLLFAGYRFFLAGALMFLMGSVMEKRVLAIKRSSLPAVLGQGMLQTAAQYFCFYIALAHMSGSKGAVLNASSTFFTILFAHFLIRGERVTLQKTLGCLIGFAGVILIQMGPADLGGGFSLAGEGMMLLCAAVYGLSSVTMKKIAHMESSAAITAYQLLFGGGLLILCGWMLGGASAGLSGGKGGGVRVCHTGVRGGIFGDFSAGAVPFLEKSHRSGADLRGDRGCEYGCGFKEKRGGGTCGDGTYESETCGDGSWL